MNNGRRDPREWIKEKKRDRVCLKRYSTCLASAKPCVQTSVPEKKIVKEK
jgi:hypothetical protein